MATEAGKPRVQSPVCGPLPAAIVKESSAGQKHSVYDRVTTPLVNASCDLFIFHNSTDGNWTSKLADRLRGARFGDRNLRLSLAGSGYKIPQPLEITENWGSLPFQQVAQDTIRLTKLDHNSPAFCTEFPITLAHCKEIKDVLEVLGQKEPSIDGRHYW